MILVIAVFIGLAVGLCRAWIGKRSYRAFELKYPGLVILAFIPQFFAFYLPNVRQLLANNLVSILLVSSLIILLIFSILNIRKASFWPISIGFLMNFLVIALNGGFMPISIETVLKLIPGSEGTWIIGQRFGYTKDVILTSSLTKLWFLSDRFVLPDWTKVNTAFSLGDIFIAIGVIWLLWMLGGKQKQNLKEKENE
jgi:hypothetical protein